eukprot:GHVR01093091.1.p1 GENE.GHVR01093091.1~~GHVR01093091.1.p1  ORF type:complete len:154 (-),score=25.56 GHVR01093091.1:239-700(-)
MVQSLQDECADIDKRYNRTVTLGESQSTEASSSNQRYPQSNIFEGPLRGDLDIFTRSQLEQHNERCMKEQDDQLDELEGCVDNLRGAATTIGGEVGLHCRLLRDLENDTDAANAKLKRNQSILVRFTRSQSNICLWLIIAFLMVLLIVLVTAL